MLDNQDKPPFPSDDNAKEEIVSKNILPETAELGESGPSQVLTPLVTTPESGLTTAAADATAPETLENTTTIAGEEGPGAGQEKVEATEKPAKAGKSFWREVLETVILTILIFFLVKSVIQNFRIEGSSMEPNFHTRQMLLVNKAAYFHFEANAWLRIIPGVKAEGSSVVWLFGGPKRGDVLVLEPPDVPTEDYIKRLIGLPGDKIEVRDGLVYINDNPLKETYIKEKPFSNYGPVTVPANALFVMGDNRNASRDGRVFGFLPFDKVVGKAMFVYWPFGGQWGIVPPAEYS